MRDTLVGERVEDVIETARAQGFTVSETQLVRWHRAGLLPPIGKEIPRLFPGRDGRGSETIYPLGTGEQAVALCRALAEKRSLPRAGWQLWWHGYEVAPAFARDPVERALTEIERFVEFAHRYDGLSDELIDSLTKRSTTPLIGTIRQRIRRTGFRRVLRIILSVYDGTFTGWQGDDEDLIERGLRIDEAYESKISGLKELLQGSVTETVQEMACLLNVRQLRRVLETTTDEGLVTAREELRVTLAVIDNVLYVIERFVGKNKFMHAFLPSSENVGEDVQPGFVLHWLGLRQMRGFATGYQQVMGALSQLGSLRLTLETISTDHDAAMKKAMRRRQPSHGKTQGKEASPCETSLHPSPPP